MREGIFGSEFLTHKINVCVGQPWEEDSASRPRTGTVTAMPAPPSHPASPCAVWHDSPCAIQPSLLVLSSASHAATHRVPQLLASPPASCVLVWQPGRLPSHFACLQLTRAAPAATGSWWHGDLGVVSVPFAVGFAAAYPLNQAANSC